MPTVKQSAGVRARGRARLGTSSTRMSIGIYFYVASLSLGIFFLCRYLPAEGFSGEVPVSRNFPKFACSANHQAKVEFGFVQRSVSV
jgi:hypothetical protein